MQCAGLSGRLVLGQGRSRAATGALKAASALKARASGALRSVAGAASPLWRTAAGAAGKLAVGGRTCTSESSSHGSLRARLKSTLYMLGPWAACAASPGAPVATRRSGTRQRSGATGRSADRGADVRSDGVTGAGRAVDELARVERVLNSAGLEGGLVGGLQSKRGGADGQEGGELEDLGDLHLETENKIKKSQTRKNE